ncbi:hypothetical protein L195_g052706 [Trifolium pratense]|uniref:Uncharacterized protein n=1 Tax=Trifolium pratense TaxID=57577 RepID=A0A2K3K6M6_TRIPR|nr:hypothetical protein L195_g052706 [Trifolium pratense]
MVTFVKFCWAMSLPRFLATDADGENMLVPSGLGLELCKPAIKDAGMPNPEVMDPDKVELVEGIVTPIFPKLIEGALEPDVPELWAMIVALLLDACVGCPSRFWTLLLLF